MPLVSDSGPITAPNESCPLSHLGTGMWNIQHQLTPGSIIMDGKGFNFVFFFGGCWNLESTPSHFFLLSPLKLKHSMIKFNLGGRFCLIWVCV